MRKWGWGLLGVPAIILLVGERAMENEKVWRFVMRKLYPGDVW